MFGCGMSYVRSLWVVVPITLVMVGFALFLAWTAMFTGRVDSFETALPKAIVGVAVFGMLAAVLGGGSASASRISTVRSRSLRNRKLGEVSLSPGAAFFISSAIVAVIAFLIY